MKAPFVEDVSGKEEWEEKTGYKVPENYENL